MSFFAWLVAVAMLLLPAVGHAAPGDDDAKKLTEQGLDHVRYKRYDQAIETLNKAQRLCRSQGCDSGVKGELYVAQAVAYGIKGDGNNARIRAEWALAEKPSAEPPERYATKAVRNAFEEAKKNVDANKGSKPPQPVGQLSGDQKECVEQAREQLEKNWEDCLQTMIACMAAGEFASGKLMLAKCNDKGGLLLEAKSDAQAAQELAQGDEDDKLIREIKDYLEYLESETPKIRLKLPAGLGKSEVKLDNQPVSAEKLKDPIVHNPGTAVVTVRGERDGLPLKCKPAELRFERRETIDFTIECPPYEACQAAARTPAEKRRCDEKFGVGAGLTVRAGLEVSSYNDNDNVDVLTPTLYGAAVEPTQGWNVSGSVTVDVVSTASADIVATASRRFDEVRFAAGGEAGYKIIKGGEAVGPVTLTVNGGVSLEPDYLGRSIGGSVSVDVWERMISPYVGYGAGFDIIGRADTDFEVFSRDVVRHTINAGVSAVLSAATLGVVAGTFQIDDGDFSKPYRYVAMFHPERIDDVPDAATPELVSASRLDIMPLEQLPDSRYRWSVTLRAMHRFVTATLRGDERLYMDSWGQKASTTDVRFLWDFYTAADGHPSFRLGPHARLHIQGPVDFWQQAYVASPTPGGTGFAIPRFRTGDRELGPVLSTTGGVGFRAGVSELLSLGLDVAAIYTQFLDHLYIFDRVGVFTATTLELEVQ